MKNNNIIKVGTDFSGIGSPEQALTNLGINYESVFACEIDKFARQSYSAIHKKPKTFYTDITKRNHSEVEQLDLYIAGFPCQTFSLAGNRKGFDDVRGTLFFDVADFIRTNRPKAFIFENVRGLVSHDNGSTFQTIISLLTDNGGTSNGQISIPYFVDGLGYHVYYYLGFPNSKTRRGRIGRGIARTLDTESNQAVLSQNRIRRLTPLECWRLQSFPDEQFKKAESVCSDTQLYKQAGNSITVAVIQKLIKKILCL